MSAETIGLLAYGLRPAPFGMTAGMLVPGAYTSMSWDLQMAHAHAGCHISAFCRNPLHPGPCKGWKGHLGLVAPGALHALEKIRHEKLEEKRKVKVKALQDAGHVVPKHLTKPIVYDPAKNKHIGGDKTTPGLGIPTQGLTPQAAKEALAKIPTKVQVGEKLDAKHAAQDAKNAAQDAASAKALEGVKAIIAGKFNGAPVSAVVAGLMKLQKAQYDSLSQEDKQKVVSQIFLRYGSMIKHAGTPAMAGMPADAADNLAKKYEELTGKPISEHAEVWKSLASQQQLDYLAKEAAGAASPSASALKPTGSPVYTTISKAGLKPGDKVFLHGKGKTAGEGQLVTVRKISGDHAKGYEFEGADGKMLPHAGGPSAKWHLSPAPGQSFPDSPAQKVAANLSGFEKGEQTKMDNLHKLGEAQKKANGQIDTLVKMHAMVSGHHVTDKQKAAMHAKATENAQLDEPKKLVPDGVHESSAKKIAAKVYPVGSNSALMHQSDLEQALAKDIHDGIDEGKPTPVLDAAKEAGVMLGQGKAGAAQALADAVHAKLGISGHDDTPNVPNTPHGPLETALGAKESDHGLSIAESTNLDHVKKTINGGNDNLPPEARAYVLSHMSKDVFDKHLDQDEKSAVLMQLIKAHQELDALPNKDNHQIASMEKAEVAYEHLGGKPMVKYGTPGAGATPGVGAHESKLKAVDVGHSSNLEHIDAVDEIKPGEYQALNPKSQQKVKDILDHLEGLGDSKPGLSKNAAQIKDSLGIPHNHEPAGHAEADAFHKPDAFGSPNAGAAPHVQQAVAYANGHQSATDTKKLAAYHQLTPEEAASLDPNTKKLMVANLEGMKKKFLAPKKQAHVLDVLNKVQVAQGGGAGAGGSSDMHTPAVDGLGLEAKATKGALAAYMHGYIHSAPGGDGHEALKATLVGMHASPDQAAVDKVFDAMAEGHAKKVLNEHGYPDTLGVGKAVSPHLVAEYKDAFKGGSKETPLADALSEGDVDAFVNAVQDHPHLGEAALGVKTAHAVGPTVDTAHALAKHAGVSEGKLNPDEFAQHYAKLSDLFGDDPADISSGYASKLGMVKGIKSIEALGLPKDVSSKLESQISDDLEHGLTSDYSHAMDVGLSEPTGVAGKIDGIVKDVNKISDDLAKKNGWPDDSPAKTSFKAALFSAQVKDALKANPGAGGGSTHTAPGHVPSPGAPNVTPAAPYSAPVQTPSATTKTEKGTILLKHAQALKVVKIMKSFPEGQYLESPEPKIWDNLVAISAHQGITPMQALTTLDDQNAKKLGLTNTNLLEKKIRAWLATGDGKLYADANLTPKPALLDHVKKVDAGHLDFTNKTGIDLPPGEKVQKLGGPGAHEENAPDSKFGKYDVATAEADQIKLKKELGVKFTPQQKAALTEYVNGSGSINGWLRDEHTPSQSSIDNAIYLQSMMLPTPRDHLLLRGTGWTQFPPEARSFEGLQKLVGETLEEPAFLSASVSKSSSGFGGAVKMHIQAPKGTMGVFTKDDQYKSQFLGSEAELLLAAKTELKVLKVWKEGGQVHVLMRVVS